MASHESIIQYRQRILDFIQANPYDYQIVNLEVVSSATLTKQDIITIDPLGLCGNYRSLRAQFEEEKQVEIQLAPDTFTYFGSLPEVAVNEGEVDVEISPEQYDG